MKHAVSHSLSPALARRATEAALRSYQERFPEFKPTAIWTDENTAKVSFSVKGMTLDGAVQLGSDKIVMDLDVPLLFRPFKSMALGVVEEEIRDWVAKASRGELDPPASPDSIA